MLRRCLVLACAACAVAVPLGCGGGATDSTAQQLMQNADKASVADGVVAVMKAAINGGDITARTIELTAAIRQAKNEGVSTTWLSQEIDDAEASAESCSSCIDLLENARP